MTKCVVPKASADIAEQIQHPRLRQFYAYWEAKRGERRFPARRDIDPLDFPYILGNLMLVDVLPDPLRFRVRLHGTELAQRAHYELTGKMLDALPFPDYRDYVIERCRGLVASGTPLSVRQDRMLGGQPQRYEALWLPFSDDGETVNLLACALIYHQDKAAEQCFWESETRRVLAARQPARPAPPLWCETSGSFKTV
jgi:hypothetical protein